MLELALLRLAMIMEDNNYLTRAFDLSKKIMYNIINIPATPLSDAQPGRSFIVKIHACFLY